MTGSLLDSAACVSAGRRRPRPGGTKERTKEYEIQFFTEANLTPRSVARFCHAGRQRLSGAPLSRDVAPRLRSGLRAIRATSAFGGRPAREYPRTVQHRSHPNAKVC